MKPIDVTLDSYAEYSEDSNEKNTKFKVGDRVSTLKHKNIFAKGYTQEKFKIEKVLKRKGDKFYVKQKRQGNSFNSCIDKKDLE